MTPSDDEFDAFEMTDDDEAPSDGESEADEPVFDDDRPFDDETRSKGVSPLVIAQVFLGLVFAFVSLIFLGIVILRLVAPHSPEGKAYGYLESLGLFAVFGTLGTLLLGSGFRRSKKN